MQEARGFANMRGDVAEEGDYVVLHLGLDRVDPIDLERALLPDRGCGFLGHHAQLGERKIGRAHVRTPVTNAHLVCRLLLEKKHWTTHYLFHEYHPARCTLTSQRNVARRVTYYTLSHIN